MNYVQEIAKVLKATKPKDNNKVVDLWKSIQRAENILKANNKLK
jgi:hypothetical protein